MRQEDALIGVYVGGRYVPDQALFRHEALRGMQSGLRGRGPLRIPAVAEAGTIQVMLGPAPVDVPKRPTDDVFIHPELIAGRPVKAVSSSGIVAVEQVGAPGADAPAPSKDEGRDLSLRATGR